MQLTSSLETVWAPRVLSVLRIMSGLLFLAHGTAKLFGWPSSMGDHLPPLMAFAGVLELAGGALLTVGLFTRPIAFVLSGMMAVAYFMAHAPQSFFPILNKGELAIMFSFVFLYFVAAGGGSWSVDALLRSKRGSV